MRINIDGKSCIGILATCTDELAILPPHVTTQKTKELEDEMGVEAIKTRIGGCSAVGSLISGNSSGFVVSPYALKSEICRMERVSKLEGVMSAAGNVILANDSAALVHRGLNEKSIGIIEKTMRIDVYRGTIAGLRNVGMAGVATNKAILLHPGTVEGELAFIERIFDLPVSTGTVNGGSPLVGSGMIANSTGYVVGSETAGHEMGRIEETFYLR
jgi:translation initiation factor 6